MFFLMIDNHIISPKDPPTPHKNEEGRNRFHPLAGSSCYGFPPYAPGLTIRPAQRIIRELPPSLRIPSSPFLPRPQAEVLLSCGVRLLRKQKSRLLLPSVETLRIKTKGESMSNRPSLVAFHGNGWHSMDLSGLVKSQ